MNYVRNDNAGVIIQSSNVDMDDEVVYRPGRTCTLRFLWSLGVGRLIPSTCELFWWESEWRGYAKNNRFIMKMSCATLMTMEQNIYI